MPESSPDQTMSDPIIIIGAGLAGLACAHHLAAAGRPVTILEASDRPGGRVRTDTVETKAGTHRIDRGFQVYLTAYPEGRRLLDLDALDLRAFTSGAMVHFDRAFHRLADPLRDPRAGLKQVLKQIRQQSPIMKRIDIAGVGLMDAALRFADPDTAWDQPEETSLAYLQRKGLSERVIERFFRPFFGGVFLDRDLDTSARKLQFTYAMFAKGSAALPAGGMGEIPAQLAAHLAEAGVAVRTNTPAERIETAPLAVHTKQNTLPASAVVLATDGSTAAHLAQASGITGLAEPTWKRTITLTFEADPIALNGAPATDPILFLNGDGVDDDSPINHAAITSNVNPAYAPAGKAQLSANIVAPANMDRPEADLARAARSQLARWFGPQAESWTHIHTDDITHALPSEDAPALSNPQRSATTATPGVYLTGDYIENASINGALLAGRRTAETVLTAAV